MSGVQNIQRFSGTKLQCYDTRLGVKKSIWPVKIE